MMTNNLLTTEDLAAEFGLPTATLHNWAYQGKGPAYVRVGRHRRYRRQDVDTWVASRALSSLSCPLLSPTPPNGRRGIKRCSDQGVKSMREAGRHKLWSTHDVKRTRHRQQVTHQSA